MAGDVNFAKALLLVHPTGANGSIAVDDISPYRRKSTVNGAAQISNAQSVFNGVSLKCTGTGDYVTWENNEDIVFTASDAFTLEFFVFPTAVGGATYKRYFATSTGGSKSLFTVRETSTNVLQAIFQIGPLPSPSYLAMTSAVGMTANAWTHIAVCGDGTNIRLFKNGTSIASSAYPTQPMSIANKGIPFVAGKTASEGANEYITEISFLRGVAKYTANFTAPAAPFSDYYGRISGNIIEGLPISKWLVTATHCETGELMGIDVVTGSTYTLNCATIDPCNITLSPAIDYAWSAGKITVSGDIVVAVNPDTTPHLWQCSTRGTTGGSEPSWNLSGNTNDNTTVWAYVGALVDPVTLGPKIPSTA